jgi:serine protease inhibitor ecotin
VIHDTGQGIGAWSKGQDNEYYGNIVYNNGWDAPDRLHGHGTYTQNKAGTKVFEDNIFFNPVGLNVRMGGTTSASTRNYSWIGNVFFNGRMVLDGPNIENLRVLHNYTYNNKLPIGSAVKSTFVNAEVRGNYLIGGVQLFEFTNNVTFTNNTVWDNNPTGSNLVINTKSLWQPTKFSINNNTYYKAFHQRPFWQFKINYKGTDAAVKAALDGFYAFNKTNGSQGRTFSYTKKSWQDDLKIDLNSTYIDAVPSETKIFVKRNKYDSKRLHIIIYNWKQADTVGVDVSSMLRAGDTYELRNVQNFFGDVIVGTYNGRLVINMKNRTLAKPIGYNQVSKWYHDPLKPNTFPTFGVFILIKTN